MYVTDTQRHIMDFIFEHQDIFKIPAGVFDDSELKSSLRTVVSRLLATIRSHLKSQLTLSIAKKTCIIDVTKSLARVSSGMELEAAHWNRMAFLRRCLRIFLIGTGDLKNIPLNICFTPRLFLMLKSDMQRKLERELGVDFRRMISTVEDTSAASEDAPELTRTDEAHSAVNVRDGAANPGLTEGDGSINDADVDAEGIPDIEDADDELSEGDSGFGLEGKPVHFNSGRFWNYVDYMLTLLRETARKDTSTKEEFEKAVASIMVQIFQDDLLDCPGRRKATKLTATSAGQNWPDTQQFQKGPPLARTGQRVLQKSRLPAGHPGFSLL
ncbi:hypothetical protein BKA83DRAFT_4486945 [Pisolithus microcarpus]|nr:hypothetical protein BKA83DRAFT_4486945 [Pisolithus microcarpus]